MLLCAAFMACKGPEDIATPDYSKPVGNTISFACESTWGTDNQLFWSADNRLGLFCEQVGVENAELGAAAISVGESIGLFYTKLAWAKGADKHRFLLYAPYMESNKTTKITGQLADIQSQQGATSKHIQENCLMYADISSEQVSLPINTQLKHVFGYMDFAASSASQYTDWSIKSITLSNTSDISFSGAYTFEMTTGTLAFTPGGNSLTLRVSGAGDLSSPFHGYAIVNPEATKGLECDVQVVIQKEESDDLVLAGTVTLDADIEPGVITTIALNLDEMEETALEDSSINLADPNNTGVTKSANCYVAGGAGLTYRFPATVMGNGYTTPATPDYAGAGTADGIIPTRLAPLSAQLLWQTGKGLITDVKFKSGYIYFTLNGSESMPLTEGNAVIAAFDQKNGTGNILWSWHIWVTSADLDGGVQTYTLHSDYTEAGATIMMDRNLGALNNKYFNEGKNNLSLGLLYQWGRKDPFLSMDDADIGVANASLALTRVRKSYDANGDELKVAAGTAFNAKNWVNIIGKPIEKADIARYPMNAVWETDTWVWLSEPCDDLWGNPYSDEISDTGHKSIYDPCPPGYRIPHRYTATMFTKTGLNTKVVADMNAVNAPATVQTNGGQIFKYDGASTTYYPACGMLFNNKGQFSLYRVGKYGGWYWTSMPFTKDARAYGYSFDYANCTPVYDNVRGVGMGIRCMKEQ